MQMKMFLALQRAGVPESDAREAAEAVQDDIRTRFKEEAMTKADFQEIKADIRSLRDEVKTEVRVLREEVKTEVSVLRGEIQHTRSDLAALVERRIGESISWTMAAVGGGVGLLGMLMAWTKIAP